MTFAYLQRFEEQLNMARKTRNFRIHVVFMPMQRDRLLPALTAGQIERGGAEDHHRGASADRGLLDPYRRNVSEVVVTAPGVPAVKTVEDLSGREVFVRRSSSYAESLRALNQQLERDGRPPVAILEAPENLEDDDILEMVNADLVDVTVVDDYLAESGRKSSPTCGCTKPRPLGPAANWRWRFGRTVQNWKRRSTSSSASMRLGTQFGNVIARRYVQNPQIATRATTGAERQQFLTLEDLFSKYGDQYYSTTC